jgi:hypothetical protein
MHYSPIHLPGVAQSILAAEPGACAKTRLRNPVTSAVFLLLDCSRFYCSRAAPGAKREEEQESKVQRTIGTRLFAPTGRFTLA